MTLKKKHMYVPFHVLHDRIVSASATLVVLWEQKTHRVCINPVQYIELSAPLNLVDRRKRAGGESRYPIQCVMDD